jgi:hypothetical protein
MQDLFQKKEVKRKQKPKNTYIIDLKNLGEVDY